jgi:glutamyl-tRNA reductase
MEHIVIIGNGIGVTLARHIRKNQIQKITIVF